MFEISYLLSTAEPCQYISGMVLSIMNATLQSVCSLSGTGENDWAVQRSIKPDLILSSLLETLFSDDK